MSFSSDSLLLTFLPALTTLALLMSSPVSLYFSIYPEPCLLSLEPFLPRLHWLVQSIVILCLA